MNREIRCRGINGEQVFHGEEIAPNDWRAVDLMRSRGIGRYGHEHLITRLANLIGEGHIYLIETGKAIADVDRAGNTWLDHEYLAPHQYLPRLIPLADA